MTPEEMTNDLKLVQDYIRTIEKNLLVGNATEHTHRPALKALNSQASFVKNFRAR